MKRHERRQSRFFYLTGADGTGKSTQAKLFAAYLESCGIRCQRLWLRFPFFFSLPLLAFARWRGYSWHEVHDKVDHGYWSFKQSWTMRTLFPWLLLVDASLAAFWKIYIPYSLGKSIVCERFTLDMLVDLSIAIEDPCLYSRLPGRLFLALIPKGAGILVLDLDEDTIRIRRPNLVYDHALSSRLEAYRLLASHLNLPIINSAPPVDTVLQEILAKIGVR